MTDMHIGIDINGLTDRTIALDWSSKTSTLVLQEHLPVILNPEDRRASPLAGRSAKLHPADRGWIRPPWKSEKITRTPVYEIFDSLTSADSRFSPSLLGAHIRHMAGGAATIAICVPDDFSAEAQSLFIDSVSAAGRYDPKKGWIAPRTHLIWRSVATVFAWAQTLSHRQIHQLRHKHVVIISLLRNNLLWSCLELNYTSVNGTDYMTPTRSRAGKSLSTPYAPQDFEDALVNSARDSHLCHQLKAISAGYYYALGKRPDDLVQDSKGHWRRPPASLTITPEMRRDAVQSMDELIIDANIPRDADTVYLVESPDPIRGFSNQSWVDFISSRLQNTLRISPDCIHALGSEMVATGCAEYAARLSHGIPTFFDYLPQIEIAALDMEGEHYEFIPLLKSATVEGNKSHSEILKGRFAIPAGLLQIKFYISKEGDKHVRKSTVDLPRPPDISIPIDLHVEQRPVSGHARVNVVPHAPDALGTNFISLDWRIMEDIKLNTKETLKYLDLEIPRAYPNSAPARTHWSVWEANKVHEHINDFINVPMGSYVSAKYKTALANLRRSLSSKVNPSIRGISGGINESLRPFGSDGKPPSWTFPGYPDTEFLTEKLCEKLNDELTKILRREDNKDNRKIRDDILISSSWMFSGAPTSCVNYFINITNGNGKLGRHREALGRVLSGPDEQRSCFSYICSSLDEFGKKTPTPWKGSNAHLKVIATQLEYYDRACISIATSEATVALNCAIYIIKDHIRQNKKPRSIFLWAVKVLLALLRHRKANPRFLSPPSGDEEPTAIFYECSDTLQKATEFVTNGPYRTPPIIKVALENAHQFLNKIGGNPDIIQMISMDEDSVDQDGDGDGDGDGDSN